MAPPAGGLLLLLGLLPAGHTRLLHPADLFVFSAGPYSLPARLAEEPEVQRPARATLHPAPTLLAGRQPAPAPPFTAFGQQPRGGRNLVFGFSGDQMVQQPHPGQGAFQQPLALQPSFQQPPSQQAPIRQTSFQQVKISQPVFQPSLFQENSIEQSSPQSFQGFSQLDTFFNHIQQKPARLFQPQHPLPHKQQFKPKKTFQPKQFQPKQFQPKQFQPKQFQPKQFQPKQLQPKQFQPKQFQPKQPKQFRSQTQLLPAQHQEQFRSQSQFQPDQPFLQNVVQSKPPRIHLQEQFEPQPPLEQTETLFSSINRPATDREPRRQLTDLSKMKHLSRNDALARLMDIAGADWDLNVSIEQNLVSGPSASDFECPSPEGHFPDTKKCSVYHQCSGGAATRQECPGGLRYNVLTNQCDWADSVDCSLNSHPGVLSQHAGPSPRTLLPEQALPISRFFRF